MALSRTLLLSGTLLIYLKVQGSGLGTARSESLSYGYHTNIGLGRSGLMNLHCTTESALYAKKIKNLRSIRNVLKVGSDKLFQTK